MSYLGYYSQCRYFRDYSGNLAIFVYFCTQRNIIV